MSKITYAATTASGGERTLVVKLLRIFILCGVWVLVGLAGLVVWARLAA